MLLRRLLPFSCGCLAQTVVLSPIGPCVYVVLAVFMSVTEQTIGRMLDVKKDFWRVSSATWYLVVENSSAGCIQHTRWSRLFPATVFEES